MIKNLSKNVRQLRESRGLAQSELARMAGISNDYMNRIENSKVNNLGLEIASALAQALKVHPSLLLFGKVLEPKLELDHEEKALYPLRPDEKELLTTYRRIPTKEKKSLREVVRAMLKG